MFDLERGGDVRCFILDNHRPLHLANIYSRHSVVVFDDTFDPQGDEYENEGGGQDVPCDGSDLSGGISSSDGESSSEEEEDEEEEEIYDEVSIQFSVLIIVFGVYGRVMIGIIFVFCRSCERLTSTLHLVTTKMKRRKLSSMRMREVLLTKRRMRPKKVKREMTRPKKRMRTTRRARAWARRIVKMMTMKKRRKRKK